MARRARHREPLLVRFALRWGLPSGFGQIDLDQQLEVFRDRTRALTGSSEMAQFADQDARDRLITVFMARAQLASGGVSLSGSATALQLLGS